MTGPNGGITKWEYDGFGRKVLEQRVDGTSTGISYSDCSPTSNPLCPASATWFARSETAGEPSSIVYYDSLERKVRTAKQGFSGDWVYEDIVYNAQGLAAKKSLPYYSTDTIYWTEYTYDALGRVVSVNEPGDTGPRTTLKAYNDLEVSTTNSKSQTTVKVYNSQGKVISVRDPNQNTTTYDYDHFGELSKVVDAAGNVITMDYDNRSHKVSMNDPDMGHWTYQYDVLGKLRFQTDAKNVTTETRYDVLVRVVKRIEPEGTSTWAYDQGVGGIGKLASVTGPIIRGHKVIMG